MKTRIITRILEKLKAPLSTGAATVETFTIGPYSVFTEPMIKGQYYSWCVKCGRPNHCGEFQVYSLGSLDVICNSCRLVKARKENYVSEVSPSFMGWSL